ncbi:MAG: sulfite exporter TauE/SafE family protein, partial [Phycisphaerales bacterium JB038]
MTKAGLLQTVRNRSRRLRLWAGFLAIALLLLILCDSFGWIAAVGGGQTSLSLGLLLAVFAGALFCEYVDSALGMGYGTTLTPVLLLAGFEPLQIVPCVLISEFITGITAAAMHHRDGNVDLLRDKQARGAAMWLSLLSIVGAIVAVSVALSIPKYWLKLIIA